MFYVSLKWSHENNDKKSKQFYTVVFPTALIKLLWQNCVVVNYLSLTELFISNCSTYDYRFRWHFTDLVQQKSKKRKTWESKPSSTGLWCPGIISRWDKNSLQNNPYTFFMLAWFGPLSNSPHSACTHTCTHTIWSDCNAGRDSTVSRGLSLIIRYIEI